MKKSKLLAAVVAAAVLSVGGAFAGCTGNEHTHTYSDDWTKDANGHWHVATCDDLKESDKAYKSGYAAHVWGEDDKCETCGYPKPTTPTPGEEYTITLDVGEGTLPDGTVTTLTTEGGKLASLPTPTAPEGKKFNGWYTAATGGTEVTTDTVLTANGTIYAQYVDETPTPATEYTITLEVGEGTLEGSASLTTVDGKLASLPTPTAPAGKKFNGWYTAAEGGTKVTTDTVFDANGAIYAQYKETVADGVYVGETSLRLLPLLLIPGIRLRLLLAVSS